MKRIAYLLVMVIIGSSIIFAQGEYLHKGESGLGISVGFSSIQSKPVSGSSSDISLGYSFRTIADLNIGYAKTYPSNMSSTISSISYYLSNQTTNKNATAALSIVLQNNSGSTNIGIGFAAARNVTYDNPLLVQPFFSVAIYPGVKKTNGTKVVFPFSLGLSIGWRDANNYCIALVPSVGYQDKLFSLGVSAVIMINTH